MTANRDVNRAQWLSARAELLVAEKAHTQARAKLAEQRRALPRVRLERDYVLAGPESEVPFAELFLGHTQLIVYHLMFGPDWKKPCIGCASWADAFNGTDEQFAKADARLIAVSRAPQSMLLDVARERSWSFPWYSALDSEFNYDFYASSHDLSPRSTSTIGAGPAAEVVEFDRGENHGVSIFQKDPDGTVFHTYSAYNRGIEALNGALGYLDLLPNGRTW